MLRKKGLLVAVLALAVALVAAGCGQKPAEKETGGQAQDLPVLRVGSEVAYPPFESVDEATKEYVGFDMDLIRAIAAEMGMKAEIKNTAWDALLPELNLGSVDLVISAMTINDERALAVNFSDPYFATGQLIITREGTGINIPGDLVGKKVGVQELTTGQYAVEKIPGIDPNAIRKFATTPDAFTELKNGGIDAVVADEMVVKEFFKANPGIGLVIPDTKPFTVEYYGIAIKKGNDELLAKVNRALAALKASGKYDEIYNKYFGVGGK